MLIKTIAFGKMWRYECDGDDCENRQTTLHDAPMPDEWVFVAGTNTVLCPTCGDKATGGAE